METPSRRPPSLEVWFYVHLPVSRFFPPYKELEGSILGFVGHTISVEVTVPLETCK